MDKMIVSEQMIQSRIYSIRGLQVMLDRDLSVLYRVETKVFNQAVKRNIKRFPAHFRFQLTKDELDNLRSQIVTFKGSLNTSIIDGVGLYHIGTSLKDLGKKWFAFSKFDRGALEILGRLG